MSVILDALIRNKEALESQIYNPEMDAPVQAAYELMSKPVNPDEGDADVYPEDLLQEFIDEFYSLPIHNAFSRALVNPRQCEIDELNNFIDNNRPDLDQILIEWNEAKTVIVDEGYYDNDIASDMDDIELTNDLDSTLTELKDHTDRILSNFPSLIGSAQGALGLGAVMNSLPNPCSGIGDFFGSLMDKGKALMAGLTSALSSTLNAVKNAINGLASQISGIINGAIGDIKEAIRDVIGVVKGIASSIKGYLMDIKNMIKDEVTKFAKSFIDGVRVGLSGLLSWLPKDPCLKGLIAGVATAGLAAVLSK